MSLESLSASVEIVAIEDPAVTISRLSSVIANDPLTRDLLSPIEPLSPIQALLRSEYAITEHLVRDYAQLIGVAGKEAVSEEADARATAVSGLDARVTENEGDITAQAAEITQLETDVAGKASASALTALTTRVTTEEGKTAANATAILALQAILSGQSVLVDENYRSVVVGECCFRSSDIGVGDIISIGPAGAKQSKTVYAITKIGNKFVIDVATGITWGSGAIQIPTGANSYVTASTNVSTAAAVDTAGEWHVREDVNDAAALALAVNALGARVTQNETDITAEAAKVTALTAAIGGLSDTVDILTVQLSSANATAFAALAVPGASLRMGPPGLTLSKTVFVRGRSLNVFEIAVEPGVGWGSGSVRIPTGTGPSDYVDADDERRHGVSSQRGRQVARSGRCCGSGTGASP